MGITISVEATYDLRGADLTFFKQIELFFMVVYIGELALRFYVQGAKCLRSGWVKFDFMLVGIGSVMMVVETLLTGSQNLKELGPLMVLRVMRLLRLARAVRLVVQFRTLWRLVSGLLGSAGTIMYTLLLLVIILYVFACLGIEIITKAEAMQDPAECERRGMDGAVCEDFRAIVAQYWSSLPIIMLTLVQFVNLDSIAAIYTPCIRANPWLALYFLAFILIVSVAVMNLVTAVIVEGAIEQAKEDKDVAKAYRKQRLEQVLPKVREMFLQMDIDGDGQITLEEIAQADQSLKEDLLACLKADDMVDLFEILDVDGSGELDIHEFVEGITKMTTSDTSVETIMVLKQLKILRREVRESRDEMEKQVRESRDEMENRMQRLEAALLGGRSGKQDTQLLEPNGMEWILCKRQEAQ